jgi:hypothetical protein
MNMSEISSERASHPEDKTHSDEAIVAERGRWHDLIADISSEIASPLTAAMERIITLTSTGRIDRQGLRSLRDEVEAARQVGMIGQQLVRFASGRLRQSHERLHLDDVLQGVIAHRTRETLARGVVLKPSLKPAEVIVDASLLFSLLNTTIDWALANTQSQVEFTIAIKTWPVHARLTCRFAHRPIDELGDAVGAELPKGLDSLTWRLLEQISSTMGLIIERKDESHVTTLTFEFPRTVGSSIEGISVLEINDGFAPSSNSQPLAGSHVLVVASRRDIRTQVRDTLRNMSLIIDFVNSVEDAVSFCKEGLPHAIIIEGIQAGERFGRFREEILAEVPDFAFIEIIEEGTAFEMSSFGGSASARVGREVLASSLPAALMFELSKGV